MVPALLTAAVVPFGSELDLSWLSHFGVDGTWLQKPIKLVIADLSVVLFIPSPSPPWRLRHRPRRLVLQLQVSLPRRRAQFLSDDLLRDRAGPVHIPVLMIFGHLNLSKIAQFQDANGWLLAPFWGKAWPWHDHDGVHFGRWILFIPPSSRSSSSQSRCLQRPIVRLSIFQSAKPSWWPLSHGI